MRKFIALFLLAILSASALAAPDDWRRIGSYSNMSWSDSDEPHTKSGYSITLYRRGNVTYGDIAIATGALEPATARLHDIAYDPATGAISFKARHSPDENGRNAETLEFSGKVEPKALVGIMHDTVYEEGEPRKVKKRVRIGREKDTSSTSYAEWNANAPPMVK